VVPDMPKVKTELINKARALIRNWYVLLIY
jgi:hypothetical protein